MGMAATEVAVAAALEADSICTTEIRHSWPGITFNVTENVGNRFKSAGGGPGGSSGPGGVLVYYS